MDKKRLMAGGTLVLTLVLGGTVYLLSRDEIAPELKGVKNLNFDVSDSKKLDLLSNVSAIDNKDGDISGLIEVSEVDFKKVGVQTAIYSISDKKGNKSEKTITITVTDRVAEEKKKAEKARIEAKALEEAKLKAEVEAKAAEEARVLAEQQAQAEAQRQAQSQSSGGGGSQSSGGGGYSSNSSSGSGGGSSYTPPAQSSGESNSGGSSYTPPASEEPSFDVGDVTIGGGNNYGDGIIQ